METLVECLSVAALSVAMMLVVAAVGIAVVSVVQSGCGEDEAEDRPSAAQPSSLKGDAQ